MSGLGSTRVVRFFALQKERGDEAGSVATGPPDAKVSGCIEPLGKRRFVADGRWGASGHDGAAVPPLSASLRRGWYGWVGRSTTWQALTEAGATIGRGSDEGAL